MNERKILEQSIEDHQAAIDKAREQLESLEEVTYSIGDRFNCNKMKGVLAETGYDGKFLVTMVSLQNGFSHKSSVKVQYLHEITQSELNLMCDCIKVRYWDSQKKIYTGDKK